MIFKISPEFFIFGSISPDFHTFEGFAILKSNNDNDDVDIIVGNIDKNVDNDNININDALTIG